MCEYESRAENRTKEEEVLLNEEFMHLFVKFGSLKLMNASSAPVQAQVKRLQAFISEHCYACNNKTLAALGKMYSGGGALTESIDQSGGEGTAAFAARAISICCGA